MYCIVKPGVMLGFYFIDRAKGIAMPILYRPTAKAVNLEPDLLLGESYSSSTILYFRPQYFRCLPRYYTWINIQAKPLKTLPKTQQSSAYIEDVVLEGLVGVSANPIFT